MKKKELLLTVTSDYCMANIKENVSYLGVKGLTEHYLMFLTVPTKWKFKSSLMYNFLFRKKKMADKILPQRVSEVIV